MTFTFELYDKIKLFVCSTRQTLRTFTSLNEGYTYVKRHFMIADRLDRMQNRSLEWVNETYQSALAQPALSSGQVIK